MIELTNITLVNFDKNNKQHLEFYKKLLNDETIKTRFQGILAALLSKNNIFDKGYLIMIQNELVGYIKIGKYNQEEKCVYLQAGAIDKEHRNKKINDTSIATIMLNEVTEYLINTYDFIGEVRLTIAEDNIPAIKLAKKCGYGNTDTTHYKHSR